MRASDMNPGPFRPEAISDPQKDVRDDGKQSDLTESFEDLQRMVRGHLELQNGYEETLRRLAERGKIDEWIKHLANIIEEKARKEEITNIQEWFDRLDYIRHYQNLMEQAMDVRKEYDKKEESPIDELMSPLMCTEGCETRQRLEKRHERLKARYKTANKENHRLITQLSQLKGAVRDLYFAGVWTLENSDPYCSPALQDIYWEQVRDLADIPKGAATRQGIAGHNSRATSSEECEACKKEGVTFETGEKLGQTLHARRVSTDEIKKEYPDATEQDLELNRLKDEIADEVFGGTYSVNAESPMDEPESALDVQEGGDHYKNAAIQPIEFITANNIGFIEGSIIKYAFRHAFKNGAEDIKKIKHYCDLLLELVYSNE